MTNTFTKVLLSVTFFFLLTSCDKAEQQPQEAAKAKQPVEIIDPWLRQMPEGVTNTAGFMKIVNNTDKPLILEDVSLDWARMAMLHESKVVDGMAKMMHQEQLLIESSLEFKPGGLHIMIMGLEQPLQLDKNYNILLHFAGREPLAVDFKVRQAK